MLQTGTCLQSMKTRPWLVSMARELRNGYFNDVIETSALECLYLEKHSWKTSMSNLYIQYFGDSFNFKSLSIINFNIHPFFDLSNHCDSYLKCIQYP